MAESSKIDMLRNQLAGLTLIGSESDVESRNMVENPTRQESDDTGEAVRESIEGDFDSTEGFKLPSPPADSPGDAVARDSGLYSAVSIDVVDSNSSRASTSSRNSYVWNSANSELPSWSSPEDKETFIWPSENKFFAATDQFEENSQYRKIVDIGNGAFGRCFLAEEIPADDTFGGRQFCVKKCQYRKNELLALELAKKEKVAEIVEFYGVKIKGGDACIFMEFMAGGTIADLIQERKEKRKGNWLILSETDSLGYLEDVLSAVKFLHSKELVHRDIKGENVLLKENRLRAKLTDFGSAESCQDASPSVDIWKIACLLLEMLNGERPPLFINEGSLQRQNSCKPEDYIPPKAIQEIKKLLRLCFGLETTDIPSAAEVLKCSYAFPVAELLKRLPVGEQVPGSENFR